MAASIRIACRRPLATALHYPVPRETTNGVQARLCRAEGVMSIKLANVDVRSAMSRNPVTIGPEVSLPAAASLMRANQVRHLPVVDDGGHLLGILTDRDLEHAAFVPMLARELAWEPR